METKPVWSKQADDLIRAAKAQAEAEEVFGEALTTILIGETAAWPILRPRIMELIAVLETTGSHGEAQVLHSILKRVDKSHRV
ncbi:hypothetical protein [Limimaricola pyoseonensis]|uniref:hypothetical protein n=1 Tax=Limimaricola pyoseonensis TaxID=521013 RepID=UPI00104216A1|nr:hypothetical protein [Limimaricola pyoseonensis]